LAFNLWLIILIMKNTSLDGIRNFLAVAEHKSFSAAALHLGVTPTAVSKAVKVLEQQHGLMLFKRNTRSVALTEAGASLYGSLARATTQIDDAFAALAVFRDRPVGNLRLTVPRALGALVMKAVMPRFRSEFPEVTIDLSLDDGAVDLVAQGYDAGIRLGQSVEQDMVAVRLTGDLSWSVVGSPDYFERAGRPATPEDLLRHETMRYRFHTSGALHKWRFVRDGEEFFVETAAAIVVNDTTLIADFARSGLGLAYMPDVEIEQDIASGRLERVLQSYVPVSTGLFLYFPARTQSQPKLRAFIDTIRSYL
jgi:DNA-binding transcriptional LysR family regulator